jgi:hypothetical protein
MSLPFQATLACEGGTRLDSRPLNVRRRAAAASREARVPSARRALGNDLVDAEMRLRLFESAAKAKDGEKMLRYSRRGLVRFSNWGRGITAKHAFAIVGNYSRKPPQRDDLPIRQLTGNSSDLTFFTDDYLWPNRLAHAGQST